MGCSGSSGTGRIILEVSNMIESERGNFWKHFKLNNHSQRSIW
jgi:hypothetical protein